MRARSADLAMMISYPTSASGIIVLLKKQQQQQQEISLDFADYIEGHGLYFSGIE